MSDCISTWMAGLKTASLMDGKASRLNARQSMARTIMLKDMGKGTSLIFLIVFSRGLLKKAYRWNFRKYADNAL